MERNKLWEIVRDERDYEKIQKHFLLGRLSETLENELKILLNHIHKPLAVRSSSLFEDSMSRPFSGIFRTYILPNNHIESGIRLENNCQMLSN